MLPLGALTVTSPTMPVIPALPVSYTEVKVADSPAMLVIGIVAGGAPEASGPNGTALY